jgi:hypothetical protein
MENLWLFFDLLLAEAENAVHSTLTAIVSECKTPTKPSVKTLQSHLYSKVQRIVHPITMAVQVLVD